MSKVKLLVDLSIEISFDATFQAGHEFKVIGKDSRGVIVETRLKGERKTFTLEFKHMNEYWEFIDD